VRHESHNAGETFINLGRRAAVCKFVSKITGVTEENGGKSQQKIIQSAAAWLISAAEKSQDFLWPIKARSRNRKTKAALNPIVVQLHPTPTPFWHQFQGSNFN
jgi:hypothetical protein